MEAEEEEEEDFDLNTFAGRRGAMQAAIRRALEREHNAALIMWHHGIRPNYARDSELAVLRDAEAQNRELYERQARETDTLGNLLDAQQQHGRMDPNNSAQLEQDYGTRFTAMVDAGYAYVGSINLHGQEIENQTRNAQLREAGVQAAGQRLVFGGQRAADARNLQPPNRGLRPNAPRLDPRPRNAHNNQRPQGNKP